ncbi:MAG: hypothetical protein GAK30_03478 [Paracidovorax wautersii]|uniref:Methyltransferase domain-containing protein n=1 Tax=Paracidovorax wautersii TaxID=1177982 RepID=A0A7V8FL71_9BURK|nr:MAG: hypothetical protein GAK30_03478 [Paracidovorax wautersii]
MAQLTPRDRLVDLGSGDGRTVITAAQRGVAARGIEYNPDMVNLARQAAAAQGVTRLATFEQADISEATVVTLFLLPALNLKLRPTLLDMPAGTRILSNSFAMDDWQPDETAQVGNGCTNWCTAHKWIVPAKVAGVWQLQGKQLDGKRLALTQTYQQLQGSLNHSNTASPISNARLNGTRIQFVADGRRYTGVVAANEIRGTIDGREEWRAIR